MSTTQSKQATAAGGKEQQQPLSKLEEQTAKDVSKQGKECSVSGPHVCQHASGQHHPGHLEGLHAGHDAAWHEAHKAEHEAQVGTKAGSKLEGEQQKTKDVSKQGKECSVSGPHVCQHASGQHHPGHLEGLHAGHDAAWHEAHKAEHEAQVGAKAGAKVVGEEHKAQEAGKATTATASPSARRRGAIEKKARQADAPVEVLDCMERELFQLSPQDVQKHDVKWLKQQILNKKNMELKSGEELLLYTQFEQWLKDDEPLSKALGDRPSVSFFRHVPHSGPFQVNLKQEGVEKPLSITAKDGEKILCLKQRIAEEHRIPAAHQRLFFMGVLLDDTHTVNDYKLPAECTLELDVVTV